MTPNPTVTVLVPSYSHGNYIAERILSIVNQGYQDFELIVIDDKSPDNSDEIITELQKEHGFTYIRRQKNSGTPFAAWADVCKLAKGKYIWICESDDVARLDFLETAVSALQADAGAVMFYCNSDIIDKTGKITDDTYGYFHGIWKNDRWDQSFVSDGFQELRQYQLFGQIVPNMSSALFTANSFRKAYRPFIKSLKLTGDWLFIGYVIAQGRVIFERSIHSQFREHEVTSRVRVKSARSQAEFILVKAKLFNLSKFPVKNFAPVMGVDVIRHLYEPAEKFDVVKAMLQISTWETIKFALKFGLSITKNPELINKYKARKEHARQWKLDNDNSE